MGFDDWQNKVVIYIRIPCLLFLIIIFLQHLGYQLEDAGHRVLDIDDLDPVNNVVFPAGRARAVYPLTSAVGGRDISLNRNPPGRLIGVRPARGPDKTRGGSYRFYGRRNSYIQFPNRGKIDTRYSITLLAWIKHEGRAGPIFHYNPRGWGVHFWMVSPRTLFVRFVKRNRRQTRAVISHRVRPRRWQFVGATYDRRTGIAKLFINRRFVARKRIGRFQIATNYNVRMGAKIGDRRYFRGRISCMQVYGVSLNTRQIMKKK